ncbi:hypothetical protein EV385_4790 [Krasilnikovia cinnamomea]|uniref:Uncharacterized protein n=1 Tax=Krasilnikovia cinnamomea TaxID=349313 RepID=A0A4V2G7J8_9ACTN|nr:hypothetical protein [Krasilnikovia cinnamomea]RZU52906.1 hypothetical protein EV385_4790 [Krasilnikovia cinnamomea]
MNPWRRTRVELAGAWRSVHYDLRRWLTQGRAPGGGAHRAGGSVTPRRMVVASAFGLVIAAGAGGGYLALGTGATPSVPPGGAPPYPSTAGGPTGGGAQAGGPETDGVRAAATARLGRGSGSPQPRPSPTPTGPTDGVGAGGDPAAMRGRFDPPRRDRPAAPTRTTATPGGCPCPTTPPAPSPVPPPTRSSRPSGPVVPPSTPVASYTTTPVSAAPSGSASVEWPSGKPTRPHRPRR